MSTLQAKVPDLLLQQVNELAAKEHVALDQIVSAALAAQVSASKAREGVSSRAQRVNWKKVDEVLARVPDVPPLPGDEL
jgi:RNA-binding protein YlmH